MTLPASLTRIAAVGTSRAQTLAPYTATVADKLVGALPADDLMAQTLVAAASLSLREQAGFITAKLPSVSVNAPQRDTRPVVHPKALDYLQVMLRGQHQEAMPEYCVTIGLTRQRVPEEVYPHLLDWGKHGYADYLRDYLLLIMGAAVQRYSPLLNARPEWQWVRKAKHRTAEDLRIADHWQDDIILDDLEQPRTSNVMNNYNLNSKYHSLWSERLTDRLIPKIDNALYRIFSTAKLASDVALRYTYRIPYSRINTWKKMMEKHMTDDDNRAGLQAIIGFRAGMSRTLYWSAR